MNMAMVRGDALASDEGAAAASTGAGAIRGGASMLGCGVTAITMRTIGAAVVDVGMAMV